MRFASRSRSNSRETGAKPRVGFAPEANTRKPCSIAAVNAGGCQGHIKVRRGEEVREGTRGLRICGRSAEGDVELDVPSELYRKQADEHHVGCCCEDRRDGDDCQLGLTASHATGGQA